MISIRRSKQTHEFTMLPFHGLLFLFFLQCFVHLTAASKHKEIVQNYNDSELLMKTVLKIDETTPSMNYKGLQMRPGVSFKMALFADLHYGEAASTDWGPQQDVNSTRVTSKILEYEAPDFVIYLGDVITANNIPIANATLYWDQAVSPTRRKGIPWASVFGNHDDAAFEWPIEWFSSAGIPQIHCPSSNSPSSGSTFNSGIVFSEDNSAEMSMKVEEGCSFKGTSRLELMKNEHQHDRLSYSTKGPRYLWPSVSNYVLPVSLESNPNFTVAFLYFLDSGGGSYPQVISNAQVKWFQQQAQEINPDSRVPEIIFWHIPTQAYNKVAPKSEIRKPCIGSINIENVAAQEAENGIMEFLAKRPSVKAIFAGHNHGLDWCCPYEKLWLCFARHTGYGGYGNWPRGSRILEINQQPFSIKSWIRMEDGSTHSEVVLS